MTKVFLQDKIVCWNNNLKEFLHLHVQNNWSFIKRRGRSVEIPRAPSSCYNVGNLPRGRPRIHLVLIDSTWSLSSQHGRANWDRPPDPAAAAPISHSGNCKGRHNLANSHLKANTIAVATLISTAASALDHAVKEVGDADSFSFF